ncbi:MAG TPA: hypothetical protein VN578_16565 [Candidatus Binatia bacterium]|nr:hypothetical protein [Candidatus Binatia bacterium]
MAQLSFAPEEFDQVLQKAQDLYDKFGRIYCPYFRDGIHFDARGLEHLRRKTWNRGREQRDQFMRLKHLARAPEILRLSYSLRLVMLSPLDCAGNY